MKLVGMFVLTASRTTTPNWITGVMKITSSHTADIIGLPKIMKCD
jgi:hypothetical protein